MPSPPAKKVKVVQQKLCFSVIPRPTTSSATASAAIATIPDTNVSSSVSSAAAENTSVTSVIATTAVLCHEEPYHPPKTFTFPKTVLSKTSRRCHAEWFRTWTWLHCVKESDSVYCYLCLFADSRGLLNKTCKRDATFVTTVFTNWKHACEKFTSHEKSETHKICAEKVINFTSKVPVTALLSKQSAQEQAAARKCLRVICSTIRVLCRRGIPLRGHEHDDGAFHDTVLETAEDVPELKTWLQKRDKWMSDTIQN